MFAYLILIIFSAFVIPSQQTLLAQYQSELIPIIASKPLIQEFAVPTGSQPHDVAPSKNGSVWYTAQGLGELGLLDPTTGKTRHIPLGQGSAPHGVIVGPDGAPWITDGGLNAIVRVDPETEEVRLFPLPENTGYVNLNTATFDHKGILWFTGQSGIYGRLDPDSGMVDVFRAPRGVGPYGISTTPEGSVYFASLAGGYIARINLETGNTTVSSRQVRTRVHDESGLILKTESGSVNGTKENWVCIILLPIHGKNGNCLEIIHNPMLYLWMTRIWYG